MAQDNLEQISEWNGALGERWASFHSEIEDLVAAFGAAAMARAEPVLGEAVADIGCGAGSTSLQLAEMVGDEGTVLGMDVSRPMLEVARQRAREAGVRNVSFVEGDASVVDISPEVDLIFSRFGVMFFSDPEAAFSHMRRGLNPRGRMAFACWRSPKENPWAVVPLHAARAAFRIEAPPADPHAPGPFAFADVDRLARILGAAGFQQIEAMRFDAPVRLGDSPQNAASQAARLGPLSRLVREVGAERLPEILDAVAPALAAISTTTPSGLTLPGAVWIVTAVNSSGRKP